RIIMAIGNARRVRRPAATPITFAHAPCVTEIGLRVLEAGARGAGARDRSANRGAPRQRTARPVAAIRTNDDVAGGVERAAISAVLAVGLHARDLHDLAADLDVQARAGAFAALGPLRNIVAWVLIRVRGRPAAIPIALALKPDLT